jgi:hypothetical protein
MADTTVTTILPTGGTIGGHVEDNTVVSEAPALFPSVPTAVSEANPANFISVPVPPLPGDGQK